jgi:hypothetical protein
MNYEKIYTSIITNAKNRTNLEYGEKHHIIPKCMGGSNKKDNLVKLTYREHFICHWLLCKMNPNNHKLLASFAKMLHATENNLRVVTSRQFEAVKTLLAKTHFSWLKDNLEKNGPWNKGKKGFQVAWNKGLKTGPNSEESNLRRSETVKKLYQTKIHPRKNKDPWNKGKKGSQIAWNKGLSPKKDFCVHCNKEVDLLNLKKWHQDNCRYKK